MLTYLKWGTAPSRGDMRQETKETRKYLNQWNRLVNRNGILCRVQPGNDEVKYQALLPTALRDEVLGHQGIERTELLIRQRCYWPTLHRDTLRWIGNCERCTFRPWAKICVTFDSSSLASPQWQPDFLTTHTLKNADQYSRCPQFNYLHIN